MRTIFTNATTGQSKNQMNFTNKKYSPLWIHIDYYFLQLPYSPAKKKPLTTLHYSNPKN